MKTKIEWTNYSLNPVKGLCPVGCSYCYARKMYRRFKWNPEIRFDVQPLLEVEKIKKPSRIFVGSTMELFGEWVDAFWLDSIFRTVKDNPQHTFIFLTKQPQNLPRWSPFPDNCWVGVTAADDLKYVDAFALLSLIEAKVKFISFEPLLGRISDTGVFMKSAGIGWVIIGACTPYSPRTAPKLEWVQAIVEAADKAGIPVFLKNNLDILLPHRRQDSVWGKLFRNENESLRQEQP